VARADHRSAEAAPAGSRAVRADVIRNRRRLLEVADELVAERGMDLPLNLVAARAGVGVGTVYRHFTGSSSLTEALMRPRVERIVALLESALDREDPVAGLREALLTTAALQAADRGIWDVMDAAPELSQSIRDAVGPPTERLIERAQASGRISPDFGLTDYLLLLWIANALSGLLKPVDPAAGRRYLEVLLDGFGITSDGGASSVDAERAPAPGMARVDEALDIARRTSRRGSPPPDRGSARAAASLR
jgi:AcrR family transcriptional regulator